MPHWLFGVRRFLVTALTHAEWQLHESNRSRDDAREFLDHQISGGRVPHGESGDEEVPDVEVACGESEDMDLLRRRLARAARRARAVQTAVWIIQAMLAHRSPEGFIAAVEDCMQHHTRSELEITAAEGEVSSPFSSQSSN